MNSPILLYAKIYRFAELIKNDMKICDLNNLKRLQKTFSMKQISYFGKNS